MIYGSTTPTDFYGSLSGEYIRNGLMNRMIVLEPIEQYPDQNPSPLPPEVVVARISAWGKFAPGGSTGEMPDYPQPITVEADAAQGSRRVAAGSVRKNGTEPAEDHEGRDFSDAPGLRRLGYTSGVGVKFDGEAAVLTDRGEFLDISEAEDVAGYLPTPTKIAAATETIRANWTETQRTYARSLSRLTLAPELAQPRSHRVYSIARHGRRLCFEATESQETWLP